MGTISMRLKDMGAWSSLRSMYSYVGDDARTQDTVFRWLFSAGVGAELQGLIEPTQETDKIDSYYPYARAMNLIPSSYASVANNPNLHLIVHIIGTLRGNSRSGNARHVPGAKEGSARKLGLWISMGLDMADDAYMWYRNAETLDSMSSWEESRKIKEKAEQLERDAEWKRETDWEDKRSETSASIIDSDEEDSIIEIPRGKSGPSKNELLNADTPERFYQLGVEKKWVLPDEVMEMFKNRLKGTQYRPGTVGAWLQKMLR